MGKKRRNVEQKEEEHYIYCYRCKKVQKSTPYKAPLGNIMENRLSCKTCNASVPAALECLPDGTLGEEV